MINLKVLSTAAAIALLLPMVAPTESFAQHSHGGRGGGGAHPGGGGMHPGGSGMHAGGGHHGGYHGGYHGGGGGGFLPGAIAGAVIGGAIASQAYGPDYYGPGYSGPPVDYYDDSAAAGPPPGDNDGVAYCMQTYRSYDPRSGTYLGYDGQRHPCP
jgi:hypothetical protein